MIVANTNTAALTAQYALSKTDFAMHTSLERLSSGLRINSAKDDAAGLAISVRVDASLRGQTVAYRSANDGISYMQTAQKGLASIKEHLLRMRDLALQSINDTNSDIDRSAASAEFSQLQAEISRISKQTTFNGISLFDGKQHNFYFSAESDTSQNVVFQALDLISETSKTGLSVFINNGVSQSTVEKATAAFIKAGGAFSTADGSPVGSGADALMSVISKFEENISQKDLDTFNTQKASFINTGGRFSSANGSAMPAQSGSQVIPSAGPPPGTTTVPISTQTDLDNFNKFSAALADYFLAAKGTDILTAGSANTAVRSVDRAIDEITDQSSKYGAFESLIGGIADNLLTSNSAKSMTLSRIVDADYAEETTSLVRNKIIQQAGQAMLSQANANANIVTSLLNTSF